MVHSSKTHLKLEELGFVWMHKESERKDCLGKEKE